MGKTVIKISFEVKNPDATWGAVVIGIGETSREAAIFALTVAQNYNYYSEEIVVTNLKESYKKIKEIYNEYDDPSNVDPHIEAIIKQDNRSDIFGGSFDGTQEVTTIENITGLEFNGGFIIKSFIDEDQSKTYSKNNLTVPGIDDITLIVGMIKRFN